jgi:hypothetical protein
MKPSLIFLLATGAMLLVGCETPDLGQKLGSATEAARQPLSVVPRDQARQAGVEEVTKIKLAAEELAKDAPASAKVSYVELAAAVKAWVQSKSSEADRLVPLGAGQVDLSAASVGSIQRAYADFKSAAGYSGSRPESGTALAVIAIGRKLIEGANARREESAAKLKAALSGLELKSWPQG